MKRNHYEGQQCLNIFNSRGIIFVARVFLDPITTLNSNRKITLFISNVLVINSHPRQWASQPYRSLHYLTDPTDGGQWTVFHPIEG